MKFYIGIILMIFLISCNNDVEDAIIEGYCYHYKTKKPIPNTDFYLENWYYKGGDYDGYSGSKVYKIKTDKNGYYSLKLPSTAYIQLDIVDLSQLSPTSFFKEKYIYREKTTVNFYKTDK